MINSKNVNVYSDQQKDGGFKHYVTFGDCAPWDCPESESVECASEGEAHKLKNIVDSLVTANAKVSGAGTESAGMMGSASC
jgi:hypothetical protein